MSAVDATLDFLDFALSPALERGPGGGGLRGGSYRYGRRLSLNGVAGRAGRAGQRLEQGSGTLSLRVGGGEAAGGEVRVTPGGRLSGRLGRQRVSAQLTNRPPQPFGFTAQAASSLLPPAGCAALTRRRPRRADAAPAAAGP